MAEICLDCLHKISNAKYGKYKYILSKELDLCEECGEFKPVVIMERNAYYVHKFKFFILPFKIIYYILYFLWRVFMLPYLVFKYYKSENKDKI